MARELEKVYEPQAVESRIYDMWQHGGYFHAERDESKKPFTIVMPPPNVTGQLHMGHAMDATLQDTLIRFKRMQGYNALWLPGVDHAGIATQIKVEEELRKEGKTRYDLGREKFLERVWDWKHKYGNRIVEQQKKLGASCDWDRARFTMDEGCSKAVREVFVSLYEKGLIYKGSRIINWCPHCVTALSDAEVEYVDKPGHLWHIRYPLADGSGEVVVATTRPETMLGDSGDDVLVPGIIVADGADFPVCDVLAAGAGMDGFLCLQNGIGKGLGILQRELQDMERQTLGRLSANAGKSCKMICQVLQCCGKELHTASLEQTAQVQSAGEPGHIVGGLVVGGAHCLVHGGNHGVLEHFHILGVHCLGFDGQADQLMLAVHRCGNHSAAGAGGKGLALLLLLHTKHFLLHLLCLLQHCTLVHAAGHTAKSILSHDSISYSKFYSFIFTISL